MRPQSRLYLTIVTLVTVLSLMLTACAPAGAPAAMDMAVESAAPAPAMEYDMAEAAAEMPAGAPLDRKIIGTASIDLVVADTEVTISKVTQLAQGVGGYVANTNFYDYSVGEKSMPAGNMTLRVPAAELDNTLAKLTALAVDVTSQSLTREDVTNQYTDLNAQLRNLEATENELRELLSEVRAKPGAKPEDILAVHRNLTEIRGQIEQVQGRKNMLDNLISLATIHLSLTPDAAELPIVEDSWRPGATVSAALRALVGALQSLGNLAIWLALYVLPVLALVLLPVVALVWLAVRLIRRRPAQPSPAPNEFGA
jgi:hypothetical protein